MKMVNMNIKKRWSGPSLTKCKSNPQWGMLLHSGGWKGPITRAHKAARLEPHSLLGGYYKIETLWKFLKNLSKLYNFTLWHRPEGAMPTQRLIDECVEQCYPEEINKRQHRPRDPRRDAWLDQCWLVHSSEMEVPM